MSKKLYVGNLSYDATDDDLKALFDTFGEVTSANIIRYRDSNRSKGFGFVEIASDEDGQKAIDELDGTEHMGRNIKVNVARPKGERPPRDAAE